MPRTVKVNKNRWTHPLYKNAYCYNRNGIVYTSTHTLRKSTSLTWNITNKSLALDILEKRYLEHFQAEVGNLTLNEAIELFTKYHISKQNERTIKTYKNAFNLLLPQSNYYVNDLANIKKDVLMNIDKLKTTHKNSTINLYISAIIAMYNFLIKENYTDKAPISSRIKLNEPKSNNKFFTAVEIEQIFIYLDTLNEDPKDKEFTTAIKLLFLTGARVSEILTIKAENIFDDYLLINGKGSRDRIFPYYIAPEMKELLLTIKSNCNKGKVFKIKYYSIERKWSLLNKMLFKHLPNTEEYRTIHAVRKTVSNIMRAKGVSAEVRGLLLGHSIEIETKTYNKSPDVNLFKQLLPNNAHILHSENFVNY